MTITSLRSSQAQKKGSAEALPRCHRVCGLVMSPIPCIAGDVARCLLAMELQSFPLIPIDWTDTIQAHIARVGCIILPRQQRTDWNVAAHWLRE